MGGGPRGSRVSYAGSGSQNTSISDYTGGEGGGKTAFISFHTDDMSQVNLLRHQAKDPQFDVEFIDNSVQEPFSSQWRARTREKILNSDVFIVTIGPETHSREAVLWEIKTAYQMGKPVIGIRLYRDRKHKIPKPLKDNGAQIVNWDMNEISNALENN